MGTVLPQRFDTGTNLTDENLSAIERWNDGVAGPAFEIWIGQVPVSLPRSSFNGKGLDRETGGGS